MDAPRGGFEGHINVHLAVVDDRVADVSVVSTRPFAASRVLVGRSIAEALSLLPRIYSLCGVAQSMAGVRAIETALGIKPSPSQRAARTVLIEAEALEQTVLRMALDWPALTGGTPNVQDLQTIRRAITALQSTICPNGNMATPGGAQTSEGIALFPALDRLETALAHFLTGTGDFGSLAPHLADETSFRTWVKNTETPVAQTLGAILDEGIADFGAIEYDGAMETSSLTRQREHLLVRMLENEFGTGLLVRLVARLVELASLPDRLRILASTVHAETPEKTATDGSGTGEQGVETARGLLSHRVDIRDGHIASYAILAPTDINFHEDGPLKRALMGTDASSTDDLLRRANLLVMAIDPCVAFDVQLEGGRNA